MPVEARWSDDSLYPAQNTVVCFVRADPAPSENVAFSVSNGSVGSPDAHPSTPHLLLVSQTLNLYRQLAVDLLKPPRTRTIEPPFRRLLMLLRVCHLGCEISLWIT